MKLAEKKCVPCEGGVPKLNSEEINSLLTSIHNDWHCKNNQKIERVFLFVNYHHTMDFVNQTAEIAHSENHHPVMHVFYNKIIIEIWTHAIDGLSENDFILAAKIDRL